jgi:hypothetical protein
VELTPQNIDKMKKIAAAGMLTVATYELVKYRRNGEKVGHVYKLPSSVSDTGNFIMGVITDGKEGMSRLSGKIVGLNGITGKYDDIEIDMSANQITPEELYDLEAVYPDESDTSQNV